MDLERIMEPSLMKWKVNPKLITDWNCIDPQSTNFPLLFCELAFSPEVKDVEDDRLRGVPNFLTNPGKKGTGYGYLDICFNPYPEYMYVTMTSIWP